MFIVFTLQAFVPLFLELTPPLSRHCSGQRLFRLQSFVSLIRLSRPLSAHQTSVHSFWSAEQTRTFWSSITIVIAELFTSLENT